MTGITQQPMRDYVFVCSLTAQSHRPAWPGMIDSRLSHLGPRQIKGTQRNNWLWAINLRISQLAQSFIHLIFLHWDHYETGLSWGSDQVGGGVAFCVDKAELTIPIFCHTVLAAITQTQSEREEDNQGRTIVGQGKQFALGRYTLSRTQPLMPCTVGTTCYSDTHPCVTVISAMVGLVQGLLIRAREVYQWRGEGGRGEALSLAHISSVRLNLSLCFQ